MRTMDRFHILKEKIVDIAKIENVKLLFAIGSFTRKTDCADIYSDIDFIIVTNSIDDWLYGNIPERLGDIKISFVEPTLGGGKERRVFFDNYLDVDMIVLTEVQFKNAVTEGIINQVIHRGYQVLYDSGDYAHLLNNNLDFETFSPRLSEEEFNNMVNDFFFHVIWATKKLYRGEMWSAKMCIDAYLKKYLLTMIELYSFEKNNCDVWHDGRFLDKWTEPDIKEELKYCFAHYDYTDMKNALLATQKLFSRLARETSEMLKYKYPVIAEKYAEDFLLHNQYNT